VYENKGMCEKISDEISDTYVKMKWILQKFAGLEGQFAVNPV